MRVFEQQIGGGIEQGGVGRLAHEQVGQARIVPRLVRQPAESEIGTGDLTVGKKIRKLAEDYTGRERAYSAAIEAGRAEVEAVLHRNLMDERDEARVKDFTDYVLAIIESLEQQSDADVLSANISWPGSGPYFR